VSRWSLKLTSSIMALAGCAGMSPGIYEGSRSPACEYRDEPGTPMTVLAAQAVPSATLLPCIDALPAGWSVSDVDIRNGHASFALDSDRAGDRAVTVVLERHCDVSEATRVPTDEPGTRRFEQIGPVGPGIGFTGTRFYLFEGGCSIYRFRFNREATSGPLGDATLALSFVPRDDVRQRVLDETGGRYQLDP
jgi:hypothetical protein